MKKLLSLACIFTTIAYQLAHAETYTLNQAEHNAPQYITVEGERYVRVPTQHPQQKYYHPQQSPQQQPQTPQHYKLTTQPSPVKTLLSAAPRFYIGADYSLNKTDISSYKGFEEIKINDENAAYSGVIGLKFNPYISFEAFYQKSDDADETSTYSDKIATLKIDTTISYKAYGADLLFTLPLYEKLDLIFGPGYAQYDFDIDIVPTVYNYNHDFLAKRSGTDSRSTGAIRYNAGLQFEIYKDLYLRAAARYVKFQKKSILKDMKELSLGLRYVF